MASADLAVSSSVSGREWDEYVSGHPDATVDHLWHWRGIFAEVFGHDSVYLAARRGTAIVGVLPLVLFRSRLFGRFVVSLPFLNYGGVLADDEATCRVLIDEATSVATTFQAAHLELRHRRRLLPTVPFREHKVACARPLPATPERLWDELDRKVRNQVRKAQKEGLEATEGGTELVPGFYGVFCRNMRELGTPVYSRRLFDDVLARFSDRARVFLVHQAGRVLAGGVAIRFRDVVLVPWASSRREYSRLCPNMLLYWSMMQRATADGARHFDFGRSSPGAGTHHFKRQWGATETPMAWEYPYLTEGTVPDQGPGNPRFERAIAMWKRCPLWFTNTVGPHLVRAIP